MKPGCRYMVTRCKETKTLLALKSTSSKHNLKMRFFKWTVMGDSELIKGLWVMRGFDLWRQCYIVGPRGWAGVRYGSAASASVPPCPRTADVCREKSLNLRQEIPLFPQHTDFSLWIFSLGKIHNRKKIVSAFLFIVIFKRQSYYLPKFVHAPLVDVPEEII